MPYLQASGLLEMHDQATVRELGGGVSATVLSVRSADRAVVVKQALSRLKVADRWLADPRRAHAEAAALRLAGRLTPGAVPNVLSYDRDRHIMVLEHAPAEWRVWQDQLLGGVHDARVATWAGRILGVWHSAAEHSAEIDQSFGDRSHFDSLRLDPYLRTVMRRRPDLRSLVAPFLAELETSRRCLVHGDFAPKNVLLGDNGRWALDWEVAHVGDPVFDLAFMISFFMLSAIACPQDQPTLQSLQREFLAAYDERVHASLRPPDASIVGHVACQLVARADGKSPALFLDAVGLDVARRTGAHSLRSRSTNLDEVWSCLEAVR